MTLRDQSPTLLAAYSTNIIQSLSKSTEGQAELKLHSADYVILSRLISLTLDISQICRT